ncbi:WhiB family transcriptional regulator [Streptomyces sp. Tue6028]|uniref:WhiB family transcriptional regulator n=1 Tax=Streptomyces sp. Tue6028 TaxID=2036037 RepID=UPI003D70C915
MSRYGATKPTEYLTVDPRFPFPHTSEPTRCQVTPQIFDYARGDRSTGGEEVEQRLEQARKACTGCPVAAACLRWALVNHPAARLGVWAATTPRERTQLRKRISDRLGPDWINVLADQDQARREQAATARHNPLTVTQARIVRLDREVNGPMPRPLTPGEQQRNRELLLAGVRSPYPAKKFAEAS